MGSRVLAGADPAGLSHAARLDLLVEIEAQKSALEATRARTLAAIEADDVSEKGWARDEVAVVLRLAPATATAHMKAAAALVARLPATLDALTAGSITAAQASTLVDVSCGLDEATLTAVETRCLDRVAGRDGCPRTIGEFRRVVRRAVATLDPRTAQQRYEAAVEQRRVVFTPQQDGTCELWALLAADAAAELKTALDREVRLTKTVGDERTADQRRADALGHLARLADRATTARYGTNDTAADTDGTHDDSTDTSHPNSDTAATSTSRKATDRLAGPAVQVTVAASTLLGLDNLPGDLAGHGPIPAVLARSIAFDPTGTWRRLLVDHAGKPLEISPTYQPPPRLRRFVTVRDRTCRFPCCSQQAITCELDHVTPWPDGPTSEANLHPLCERHHHLKHEAPGWNVRRLPDSTTRWTAPTGRTIDVPPDTYDDVPGHWPARPAEPDPDDRDTTDIDVTAPIGGYDPDAPPDLDEPPEIEHWPDEWSVA